MLHQFVAAHRDRIFRLAREKAARKSSPRAANLELDEGLQTFLSQLVGMLQNTGPATCDDEISDTASKHGNAMRREGFTVGQVAQDYGQICQAITEIAVEQGASIGAAEFKTLNGCLDAAVAAAITEFGRARDEIIDATSNRQLGALAHELRNALHTATLGFDALQSGLVGSHGSTSQVVLNSLSRMRTLLDRSLAEVRVKANVDVATPVFVAPLVEQVALAAGIDASHLGVELVVGAVANDVMIHADKQTLVSALSNLLQNALKFSRVAGHVSLTTHATADRVEIAVEDECGGLPAGPTDVLFEAFEQRGTDRTGVGLGLAISRRAIENSGGTLGVRDMPGKGCVFTVSLPRRPAPCAARPGTSAPSCAAHPAIEPAPPDGFQQPAKP